MFLSFLNISFDISINIYSWKEVFRYKFHIPAKKVLNIKTSLDRFTRKLLFSKNGNILGHVQVESMVSCRTFSYSMYFVNTTF